MFSPLQHACGEANRGELLCREGTDWGLWGLEGETNSQVKSRTHSAKFGSSPSEVSLICKLQPKQPTAFFKCMLASCFNMLYGHFEGHISYMLMYDQSGL